MNAIPRTACTLAAILAAPFSSHAAVTVFQNDLAGFTAAVGLLPVIDFDGVTPGEGADLAGMSIREITFTSPAGNTLNVVDAASTASANSFLPAGDSDNRLFATTGTNVLSPGGPTLVPGIDPRESDGLRVVLPTPVRDFGIDVLFQSLDADSSTSFELRNSAGAVIASGTVNIPMRGAGTDPASSSAEGGAVFIGFHSDQADIAQIDFLEIDRDAEDPDANIGYDTIRVVAAGPQTGRYAFTHISDNYFGVPGLNPAINGMGTVVFLFPHAAGYGLTARSSAGGPETTLADDSAGFFDFYTRHAVNQTDTVAFPCGAAQGRGIFAQNTTGGAITTVANDNGAFEIFGSPALNSAGLVVFDAVLDPTLPGGPTSRGIYLGSTSGGPPTALVNDGGMFALTNGNIDNNPDINDAGTVAFFAPMAAGGEGIFTISSSGGPITTVADTSGPFRSFEGLSINNAGTVAFRASLHAGGEGVFRASSAGGTPTLVAAAGINEPFSSFSSVTINNAGTVAFLAELNTGTGGQGIFKGPDAIHDRVIVLGDTLFTSTVTSLQFAKEGFNDSGQIAFGYLLADGRSGVAVATPSGILRIRSVTRRAATTSRLEVEGFPNLSHSIQATNDLGQPFTAIGTRIAAPDGTFQFEEVTAAPRRFYRVTLP